MKKKARKTIDPVDSPLPPEVVDSPLYTPFTPEEAVDFQTPVSGTQAVVAESAIIQPPLQQIESLSETKERSLIKPRKSAWRMSTYNELLAVFSPAERLILYVFAVALGLSSLGLLSQANALVSVDVPSQGGAITEGVVGPARFVNPLLATSDADQDLTQLVYSGLTRARADGSMEPDLASNYVISPDGTTYTFTLRPDAVFQDGQQVTSADVLYTIKLAQNPEIKSSHRADWEGVTVTTPDDRTIVFTLPHAYAPFIENTSLGILPEHLWKSATAEDFPFNPLNTHPIGTGPYMISSVNFDANGSATRFQLAPFARFTLGNPHIKSLSFVLFPNEGATITAFNQRTIDAIAGVSAEELKQLKLDHSKMEESTLPRVFGVFLNQSHSAVLADSAVRTALNISVDRNRLIKVALGGYGSPLSGPLPTTNTTISPLRDATTTISTAYTMDTIASAKAALVSGGWVFNSSSGRWKKGSLELAFTLATADTPELTATANAVATAWRQMGAQVTVQVYPLAELNTNVIRPRAYDALLFGEVVGRDPDLYAFWHSTQRADPGLNLSLYANAKADTLLSQARATTKKEDRDKLYTDFAALVAKDQPAIFLYAPDFLYVTSQKVTGVRLGALTTPSERFLNVYEWYTDTEHVWEIFAGKINQTL